MKYVKLLSTAYVNGVMRHPHEGVLHLEDDEADRLIGNEAGEDVTSDFAGVDDDAPTESLTASPPKAEIDGPDNPHLSEVLEDKAEAKSRSRKATGEKE